MRYLAELDADDIVQRVIVASDSDFDEWHLVNLGAKDDNDNPASAPMWAECFKTGATTYPRIGYEFRPWTVARFVPPETAMPSASNAPAPSGGDDTAALQSWIDGLAAGARGAFSSNGAYRVDGSIQLNARSNLDFDLNGATLTATTHGSDGPQILMSGCAGIRWRNGVIVGENPDPGFNGGGSQGYEDRHGISIKSCTDCWVDGMDISGVYADPVYVGAASTGTSVPSDDTRITDCALSSNGRMLMGVVCVRRLWVDGCTFDDGRRAGIDLEPNAEIGQIRWVTIKNCGFGHIRLYPIPCEGYGGDCGYIFITDNESLPGGDAFSISVNPPEGGQRRGPIILSRNTVIGSSNGNAADDLGTTWALVECDGVYVRDNEIISLGNFDVIVDLNDCTDIAVSDNTYPPNAWGQYLEDGVLHP